MIGEKQQFKIKGMQQDTTESSFSGEFAFENMNMHIEAMESNTLLALTTQVGNTQVPIIVENTTSSLLALKGTPIGYSIVNNTLVIFTTDNTTDRIYKIYKTNEILYGKLLFEGSLNFNTVNPIECIPFYENENIQKVYWTDGRNQPRLINLTHTSFNKNSFDFVQDLSLKEKVTIVKNDVSEGMFPSGTVQYAFTYYNKYAQESNIFYVSPIYYSSFKERGGTGEEKVNNSFSIDVKNLDSNFEFLRIYSIVRTNIDSTPLVKKVIDVPIIIIKSI